MRELEKISQELFDKLRSRFDTINLGDENAKHTSDPEKARFFNFDYEDDNGKYGNVTVGVQDGENLKIFFGKKISKDMTEESKEDWYKFLRSLRFFAKRNLLTFDTRDISRSSLNLRDIKQASKADGTYSSMEIANESRLYGTNKISFENVGSARIRIIHNENINPEVRGSRSRGIKAIYVENNQGERFKLQHNKLSGARAMARHIAEGGAPYDDIGQHINSMVAEMQELGRFVRVMKHRTFEDTTTTTMVEAAAQYYNNIHNQLNFMRGHRAYRTFVENFEPQTEQLDEVDVNELKEKFVKKIFDDRMMSALPLVNKAYYIYEQTQQRQLESVKSIVKNRAPLQLIANEGMDDYFRTVSFGDKKELVVRVLEDIANRAAELDVAEFAKHWATNFNNITESSSDELKENQTLAVQLATQYLRDLRRVNENHYLRIDPSEYEGTEFVSESDLYEGQWSKAETENDIQKLKELLSSPLQVGVDAHNATDSLYDLLGDDKLFDRLHELSEIEGPKADAVPAVKNWLKENDPLLLQKLGLPESGDEQMDQPEQPEQPEGAATPEAGAPATAEAPPPEAAPAAAPPGTTAAPGTEAPPVAEDVSLRELMRLSGIQSFLVK
jgi:hypothetical protein